MSTNRPAGGGGAGAGGGQSSSSAPRPSSSSQRRTSTRRTATPTPGATTLPVNNIASTGRLGTATTVVIAVLASVCGIVLIFVIFRCARRRINRDGAPLPPVQPIAHHRERNLAQHEERKFNNNSSSVNDSTPGDSPGGPNSGMGIGIVRNSLWAQQQQHGRHLMTPGVDQKGSSSDSSPNPSTDNINNVGAVRESPSPNQSLINHNMDNDGEKPLPQPMPAFHQYGASGGSPRSSIGSIAERSHASSPSLSPYSFPESPSPTPGYSRSLSRSSTSNARHQMRSVRPLSVISISPSYAGSVRSSNTTTIRGAPHGPHSNVQIVLPMPLAPQLSPYNRGGGEDGLFGDGGGGGWVGSGSERVRPDSRLSVVDKWAAVPLGGGREKGKGRRDGRERTSSWSGFVGGGTFSHHF
jgi:hypothetical protein